MPKIVHHCFQIIPEFHHFVIIQYLDVEYFFKKKSMNLQYILTVEKKLQWPKIFNTYLHKTRLWFVTVAFAGAHE